MNTIVPELFDYVKWVAGFGAGFAGGDIQIKLVCNWRDVPFHQKTTLRKGLEALICLAKSDLYTWMLQRFGVLGQEKASRETYELFLP